MRKILCGGITMVLVALSMVFLTGTASATGSPPDGSPENPIVNATVRPSSTKTLPNTGGPHALALLLAASLLGLGTVLVRRRA